VPDLRRLFAPHASRVRASLEPGLTPQVTWTSGGRHWREFADRCLQDLDAFADLMSRAADIWKHRIEKLLAGMGGVRFLKISISQRKLKSLNMYKC